MSNGANIQRYPEYILRLITREGFIQAVETQATEAWENSNEPRNEKSAFWEIVSRCHYYFGKENAPFSTYESYRVSKSRLKKQLSELTFPDGRAKQG